MAIIRRGHCRTGIGLGGVYAFAAADRRKLTPDQLDFFEKRVRPVFVDNCYKCHSHDSE